ncbi:MAG TPA: anhydro-N-acetylmuramic acid kinase [Clostridia bacterium]|mgnify:FL=1|nr:anhydro-N-acetylmuramic acid kinase [Clostridia bacterium]
MLEKLQEMLAKPSRLCAGVMSGTSLDGLDIAICRIHGSGTRTRMELVHFETQDYAKKDRQRLLRACAPDTSDVAQICALNKWLGVHIGNGVVKAMENAKLPLRELDFVASHGQTVYHMPEIGATLQIGEGADIAALTGAFTVSDFRVADMAYGGQGAPLASFFDYLMCRSEEKARVLINTGGIANLTALPAGANIDDVMAFDTGPANVLIDNLMKLRTNGALACDRDGALAASGRVCEAFLQTMAQEDPFLPAAPPKTTGRELYTCDYAKRLLLRGESMGLGFEDILATVTDYSAYCVAYAVERFVPFAADEFYQTGGGYHNLFFRQCMEKRLKKPMLSISALGVDGDAKEACFFAIFGNEFLHGQFNNAKSATGARRNVVMGKLSLPSVGL